MSVQDSKSTDHCDWKLLRHGELLEGDPAAPALKKARVLLTSGVVASCALASPLIDGTPRLPKAATTTEGTRLIISSDNSCRLIPDGV